MADVQVKQTIPALSVVQGLSRNEADRLSNRLTGPFHLPSRRRLFDPEPDLWRPVEAFMPAVDVSENEGAYRIMAELPGLAVEDIEVSVVGDSLLLKGEKRREGEKDGNYHLVERTYGSFQRAFMLPQGIDREGIAAELAKGVLIVTLPKTIAAQKLTKRVEIRSA